MIHIALEGLDGSGKSTLAQSLFETMTSDPTFCKWLYLTKEPGAQMRVSPGIDLKRPGADLREIVLSDPTLHPMERELLFYADASQHKRFIQAQGNAIVLSDRGKWSHLAYLRACVKTERIPYEHYTHLKGVANATCHEPDLVLYLRGDLELMKERLLGKKKDAIESYGDSFFKWVLDSYDDLAFENPKCLILDAKNSILQNVENVIRWLKEVWSYEELYQGRIITRLCG